MTSGQGMKKDDFHVVVKFPLSLSTRCGDMCALFWRPICIDSGIYGPNCGGCCCWVLVILFVIALLSSPTWIGRLVLGTCHITPVLALQEVSIRNMAVYHNNTINTTIDLQWQVKREFNVTLSAWNRNTLAGCFTTYWRMIAYVGYHGALVLQQEVPLGFGLKPRRSRSVSVQLKGDHFPLKQELGQLLEAELRNASMYLQFYFDTRYLRNDRKADWMRMGCGVVAKTPLNTSRVGGNLLWKQCSPS